jgi:hypothetical protein
MSLRFFADHCVPALAIRLLRDEGGAESAMLNECNLPATAIIRQTCE